MVFCFFSHFKSILVILGHSKSLKVILSHSKSFFVCKSRTRLIGVGLVFFCCTYQMNKKKFSGRLGICKFSQWTTVWIDLTIAVLPTVEMPTTSWMFCTNHDSEWIGRNSKETFQLHHGVPRWLNMVRFFRFWFGTV